MQWECTNTCGVSLGIGGLLACHTYLTAVLRRGERVNYISQVPYYSTDNPRDVMERLASEECLRQKVSAIVVIACLE